MSDLMEHYRRHRCEIDLFAQESTLFALAYVLHAGPISLSDLRKALGLDADDLKSVSDALLRAGFFQLTTAGDNNSTRRENIALTRALGRILRSHKHCP